MSSPSQSYPGFFSSARLMAWLLSLGLHGWLYEILQPHQFSLPHSRPLVKTHKEPQNLRYWIVETPLKETLLLPNPHEAAWGVNDHRAIQEKSPKPRAQLPGLPPKKETKERKIAKTKNDNFIFSGSYESFLAQGFQGQQSLDSQTLLSQEDSFSSETGYWESREGLPEGEILDLNTKSYRYISYFSQLRRSIELVWIYPREAAKKGFSGQVSVKFSLLKNGKLVDVFLEKSSGYVVLDQSILEALRLAAPFPPLPESWEQSKITVTGTFSYVLNQGGSH